MIEQINHQRYFYHLLKFKNGICAYRGHFLPIHSFFSNLRKDEIGGRSHTKLWFLSLFLFKKIIITYSSLSHWKSCVLIRKCWNKQWLIHVFFDYSCPFKISVLTKKCSNPCAKNHQQHLQYASHNLHSCLKQIIWNIPFYE